MRVVTLNEAQKSTLAQLVRDKKHADKALGEMMREIAAEAFGGILPDDAEAQISEDQNYMIVDAPEPTSPPHDIRSLYEYCKRTFRTL